MVSNLLDIKYPSTNNIIPIITLLKSLLLLNVLTNIINTYDKSKPTNPKLVFTSWFFNK